LAELTAFRKSPTLPKEKSAMGEIVGAPSV